MERGDHPGFDHLYLYWSIILHLQLYLYLYFYFVIVMVCSAQFSWTPLFLPPPSFLCLHWAQPLLLAGLSDNHDDHNHDDHNHDDHNHDDHNHADHHSFLEGVPIQN